MVVRLLSQPGPSPPATGAREPLKVLAVPRNFFVVLLSSFQRPRTLAPSLRPSYRLYPCCSLPCPSLLPAPLRPADDRLPAAPLDCPAPHPSSRFRGRASYRACQLRVKLLVLRPLRAPRRSPSRAESKPQGRRCVAKAIRRVNFPRARLALRHQHCIAHRMGRTLP